MGLSALRTPMTSRVNRETCRRCEDAARYQCKIRIYNAGSFDAGVRHLRTLLALAYSGGSVLAGLASVAAGTALARALH